MNFNDVRLVAVAKTKTSRAQLFAEDTRTQQRIWLGEVNELRSESPSLRSFTGKVKLTFTLSTALVIVSERGVMFECGDDTFVTAVNFVESNFSLPRCRHGQALKDHSGALLEPSCGCRADTAVGCLVQS